MHDFSKSSVGRINFFYIKKFIFLRSIEWYIFLYHQTSHILNKIGKTAIFVTKTPEYRGLMLVERQMKCCLLI